MLCNRIFLMRETMPPPLTRQTSKSAGRLKCVICGSDLAQASAGIVCNPCRDAFRRR